jgi:hypothetical protein
MSINNSNISDFITFLFRKRKGTEPPPELLERWKALTNDEIGAQLSGLFQSWGLTDEDKRMEINTYFKEALFTPKTASAPQPRPRVVAVPADQPAQQPFNPFPPKQKKKSRWTWITVLALVLIGGFVGVRYISFAGMQYVYTITDNVLVRNEAKDVVARMDLYAAGGSTPSFQKLKAVDKEIYQRSIDNTDKVYPCRKVLLGDISFLSYLFKGTGEVGYVNTNYVVDNVKEFNLYQTAFKEVKNNKAENSDLKAIYRKIIIGSMSLDPAMENRYITLHTNSIPRSAADATYGIIKQNITNNVKYILIAGLSDGYYYSFEGDVQSNDFTAPQKIMLVTDEGEKALTGTYRFMNRDGKIILYDCLTNSPTNYEAQKDGDGKITSFAYKEPKLLDQIIDAILPGDNTDTTSGQ